MGCLLKGEGEACSKHRTSNKKQQSMGLRATLLPGKAGSAGAFRVSLQCSDQLRAWTRGRVWEPRGLQLDSSGVTFSSRRESLGIGCWGTADCSKQDCDGGMAWGVTG